MKNQLQKAFTFSDSEFEIFKKFLFEINLQKIKGFPLQSDRPKFPGMPNFKLIISLEEFVDPEENEDTEMDVKTEIHAVFESEINVAGYGSGNEILLKSLQGIDQFFISNYSS